MTELLFASLQAVCQLLIVFSPFHTAFSAPFPHLPVCMNAQKLLGGSVSICLRSASGGNASIRATSEASYGLCKWINWKTGSKAFKGKGKGTLLVTCTQCTVKFVLCFNPSLRSSGQPQCGAPGTNSIIIISHYLGQEYWLEIDLANMFWWWGGTGAPGENPCRHREKMQTPHRKVLPQPGIKPRTFLLWGVNTNHYATMYHYAIAVS